MEFKEFSNPESNDYDVASSVKKASSNEAPTNSVINPYTEQLLDLIGILEDVTEKELQQNYGIGLNEYFNPSAETVSKVRMAINKNVKHR